MLTEHIPLPQVSFPSFVVIRPTPNSKWRLKWQLYLWNNGMVLDSFETQEEALEARDELRTRIFVAQALGA